jgi:hypothetical protein
MDEINAIPMIIATKVMKPGRARIGSIGNAITLPRTVSIVSLVAGLIGLLAGAVFGLILGPSMRTILMGAVFGAAIGVVVVNYSPLKGESLLTWFGLTVKAKRQQIYVNGQPVRLSIGICPVTRAAVGPVRIQKGAINIPPTQYDERGVLISKKNHNISAAHVSTVIDDLLDDDDLFTAFPGPTDSLANQPLPRRTLGDAARRS